MTQIITGHERLNQDPFIKRKRMLRHAGYVLRLGVRHQNTAMNSMLRLEYFHAIDKAIEPGRSRPSATFLRRRGLQCLSLSVRRDRRQEEA